MIKKAINAAALIIAAAGTPALAANLENPLYLPKGGEVYSKTGFGVMYKTADGTEAQLDKVPSHAGVEEFPIWRATEEFGYGIIDGLAVVGQFGYTYNGDIERKGLHLGRLGLAYRVMADASELVWDVYADAHLGGVSKMTGVLNIPGGFNYDNYTTGQYGAFIGTKVGKTWDKLTGMAYAELGYYLPSDNTKIDFEAQSGTLLGSIKGDAVAKMGSFLDWNVGTKWTYDLAPEWTGGLGFAWKHHGEHKVKSAKVKATEYHAGLVSAVPGIITGLTESFDNTGLKDSFDEFPITISIANQLTDNVQVALYGEYTFDDGDTGSQNTTDTKVELGARVNVRF